MKPRAMLAVRPPVDPAAAEAFLAGRPFAPTVEAPSSTPPASRGDAVGSASATLPSSGRKVHERKDGRRVRRTTILMAEELARRVDVFAASRGLDKTTVHEAALEAWLRQQGG